jgi:hypothetical protein
MSDRVRDRPPSLSRSQPLHRWNPGRYLQCCQRPSAPRNFASQGIPRKVQLPGPQQMGALRLPLAKSLSVTICYSLFLFISIFRIFTFVCDRLSSEIWRGSRQKARQSVCRKSRVSTYVRMRSKTHTTTVPLLALILPFPFRSDGNFVPRIGTQFLLGML